MMRIACERRAVYGITMAQERHTDRELPDVAIVGKRLAALPARRRSIRPDRRRDGIGGDHGAGAQRAAAMIGLPAGVRVWLATGHTDMRKGFEQARLDIGAGDILRSWVKNASKTNHWE
jgi:hypothetical protein